MHKTIMILLMNVSFQTYMYYIRLADGDIKSSVPGIPCSLQVKDPFQQAPFEWSISDRLLGNNS